MSVHTAKVRKALMGDFVTEDVHDYRIDRHSFTVYVGGDPHVWDTDPTPLGEPGVEHHMADRFEMNLGILSAIDPNRPILVNMSSCGGHWEEGMKMFGAILTCPNPVTVLGTKWCRSMTSIIPLAADRFVIRPPAQYMIHRGTYGFYGLDQEADTDDVQRRKTHEVMMRLYEARLREQGKFVNNPVYLRKELEDRIRNEIDVWLSADEAVQWGFADEVFDGDYAKLRATKCHLTRRANLLQVLRRPVKVELKIT